MLKASQKARKGWLNGTIDDNTPALNKTKPKDVKAMP